MLSLDVFSVLLLKRHGIYMVFEAFSTVNFIFREALLERFLASFWPLVGGASGRPFWSNFWAHSGTFGGPFWTHVFKNPPHSGHESA